MKKLSVQEVLNLLEMASAVILDEDTLMYATLAELTGEPENTLVYAALAELTGEPENEIACFSWDDSRVILTEESCACATLSNSGVLTVQDNEGAYLTIVLLVPYAPKEV